MHKIFLPARSILFVALFILLCLFSHHARALEAPRIMVMIDEKNLGAYTVSEAEKVVVDHLLSRGIEVVDAEMVHTTINRDKALQAMTGGTQAAASLGLQFGAEIVITGKAVAKGSAEQVKDTSFRSYQAQVNLRAIRTDTAEVLASESAAAAKIHVDDVVGGSEAIRMATTSLVPTLLDKVLAGWANPRGGNRQKIQLVIGNVTQVWQVAAVKKLLREEVPGVQGVTQRSFVSGTAVFEVRFGGDSQALAEKLTLSDSGYFSLRVLGITASKLDMRLVESGS